MSFLQLPSGRSLTVCGYEEVPERLGLCTHKPVVLSIEDLDATEGDGKAPILGDRVHAQLVQRFTDTTQWMRGISPTASLIGQGVGFIESHPKRNTIIHCKAGMSRSTAMAAIIINDEYGPGNEARAIADLLSIRPIAAPNPLILLLAGKKRLLRAALDNEIVYGNLDNVHRMRHDWVEKNRHFANRFLGKRSLIPVHRILRDRLARAI